VSDAVAIGVVLMGVLGLVVGSALGSYLARRGRRRRASRWISPAYPLLGPGLGAAFIAALLAFDGDAGAIALALALLTTLAAITITDLERRLIPNQILAVSAAVGIAIVAISDPGSLPERAIAALAAAGVLLALALAYRGGMGMGDVKLTALIGLYLGRGVAPALLVALAIGAAYGLVLIARHGLEARSRSVPFGPFLALGSVVGLFWGEGIVDWYLDTALDG
jgi:leader peptidase (prepilin peptidase)/N-methyltransferase